MRGASVHRTTEIVTSGGAANRSGAFRFWLVLAMIAAYFATMAFLIYSARHATETAVVATDFSPAMIAVAICMAFSIILTGVFVLVRQGD
jgi:hypothetical protein